MWTPGLSEWICRTENFLPSSGFEPRTVQPVTILLIIRYLCDSFPIRNDLSKALPLLIVTSFFECSVR